MKKKWIAITVILVLLAMAVSIILAIQQNDVEKSLTFEEFLEMTPAEQQEYMESYEDINDFLAWYNKAKEEYEKNQDYTEIGGDGSIDLGEGGKN